MAFNMAVWDWPQWTYFILAMVALLATATLHGKPKEGNWNAFVSWFRQGFSIFLLICGGFFG